MKKNSQTELKKSFTPLLLKWNREQNTRQMPWKAEKDPYKIWLSEIILQQTRVEQGLNYYNNFIKVFPGVHQLAKAPEARVFKLWEGLGYYTRCRNLIASARHISQELKGKFPVTYEEIKALKGVGPYTAAAISSFAFNLPHAVVDGNVLRVLARVFGIDKPVDSTAGKKYFTALAEELLNKKRPGIYNQAIMDFGAVICKPQPVCSVCVFQKHCYAFRHRKINQLPVKEKKILIKKRWFYYLVMEYKNEIAVQQRTAKDIWHSLYEFPMIEAGAALPVKKILMQAEKKNLLTRNNYELVTVSSIYKQKLSHQLIFGQFITMRIKKKNRVIKPAQWIAGNKIKNLAFPQFINQFLKKAKHQ